MLTRIRRGNTNTKGVLVDGELFADKTKRALTLKIEGTEYDLRPTSIKGTVYYVAPTGSNSNTGLSWSDPFLTIQKAVTTAVSGDVIVIAEGDYDETVTIVHAKSKLTLIGQGNRGAVCIAPQTVGAEGLFNRADDVTLVNIGVAGETTADYALKNTGSRFRAYGCKFEGADTSGSTVILGMGSVAQIAAETDGKGADCLLDDCEIAWAKNGIVMTSSDYGANTQNFIKNCHFHNCVTVCIGENDVSTLGAVRNILIQGCTFDAQEDGTATTDIIDLNTVGCTGLITENSFALATNNVAVLQIASGILWVANKTEAGVSTARPA